RQRRSDCADRGTNPLPAAFRLATYRPSSSALFTVLRQAYHRPDPVASFRDSYGAVMRLVFTIPALLALAACATPRENCINDVTRELREVTRQISISQDILSRGYITETRQ